jgi:hypothetical protein
LVLKDCQFPRTVREAKIFRKMLKAARDANVYFTRQRVRDMGRALKKVDHLFVINAHLSSRETDHMRRLLAPRVDPKIFGFMLHTPGEFAQRRNLQVCPER